MTPALPPVIIGAGPAGVRAAQTLLAHGLRPVLLDEAPRPGGQIYRQPPIGFDRPRSSLYGFEAARAASVHQAAERFIEQIDYRPDTLVWNAAHGRLDLLRGGSTDSLAYGQVIVATGATDRVLPFPGWTKPGVYALGGAQVALKYQGCAIGERVVFAGTGPLLYLVAYQYAKAGATVVAVLDTAPWGAKVAALPAMARNLPVLAKGLYYRGWLRLHGVPVYEGVTLEGARGGARVESMHWRRGGSAHSAGCDAVAFGHALRPETQLADLLGCEFAYDELQRAAVPHRDAAGRTTVADVYVAGDGAGIMGADAAEWAGERAALALLADRGTAVDAARAATLEAKLAHAGAFRRGIERAFPFPEQWAAQAADDLVVCRCEEVTAAELRHCVRETGTSEINRLKALTRVGMGRCQGRMCGTAAAEILAQACGRPAGQVGFLRAQMPIKPLPFAALRPRVGDAE